MRYRLISNCISRKRQAILESKLVVLDRLSRLWVSNGDYGILEVESILGGGVINLFVICVNFLCRYPRFRKSLSFQYEMISWIGLYKTKEIILLTRSKYSFDLLYGLQWWTSPWDSDEMRRTIFFVPYPHPIHCQKAGEIKGSSFQHSTWGDWEARQVKL